MIRGEGRRRGEVGGAVRGPGEDDMLRRAARRACQTRLNIPKLSLRLYFNFKLLHKINIYVIIQEAMSNCMETDKKIILRFLFINTYLLYNAHICDGYDPSF
jgi:hypothetical protein